MKKKQILLFTICFIAYTCILLYTHIFFLSNKYVITNNIYDYFRLFIGITTDVLLPAIISTYLIRKNIYYTIVLLFVAYMFATMNILYSKVFYTYFPVSLFSEYQNLNGISDNIISLFDLYEIIFFIILLILILLLIYKRKNIELHIKTIQISHKQTITLFAVSIIFIVVSKAALTYEKNSWVTLSPKSIVWGLKSDLNELSFDSNHFTFSNGFILTYIFDKLNKNTQRTLSIEERNIINSSLNNQKCAPQKEQKNIILIIVESLMSNAVGYTVNNKSITPTFDYLIKNSYYNNNMKCQINKGMSSDGQFIYFTGLLPHSHRITICDYNQNKYEGLATRIKEKNPHLYTAMVIPTIKTEWKQNIACQLYGIDELYSIQTYEKDTKKQDNVKQWLNDKQVFEYAQYVIRKNRKKSFFLTVLTSSMHAPYNKEFDDAMIKLPQGKNSKEFLCYLQKINYTDFYLGKFIDFLKTEKIYDNTMIIIASDHSEPMNINEFKNNKSLPLLITNTDYNKIAKDSINQIDLYPTVLYLTNATNDKYNGLGNVIFNKRQSKQKDLQHISDLIIESDFFNQEQ